MIYLLQSSICLQFIAVTAQAIVCAVFSSFDIGFLSYIFADMTVSIINNPDPWYFLTKVPDIVVSAESETIKVEVTVSDGVHSETPISQYYAVSDGIFTLFDLSDLCKSFMEAHSTNFCSCYISASALDEDAEGVVEHKSFNVWYESFDAGVPAQKIEEVFFLSSDKRILYKDAKLEESVGFVIKNSDNILAPVSAHKNEVAHFFCFCLLEDGSSASVKYELTISSESKPVYLGAITFTYALLLSAVKDVNANVVAINSFRIEMGKRVVSYVVSDDNTMNNQYFTFVNCFGFVETIGIPAVVKEVHSHTQSVALTGHTRIKYDARTEQSFEVQSGALASFIEPAVDNLLASRKILSNVLGRTTEVLITDSTWEKSNEIGTVNTVKFTYKLSDDRVSCAIHELYRIFDNTYDLTYG